MCVVNESDARGEDDMVCFKLRQYLDGLTMCIVRVREVWNFKLLERRNMKNKSQRLVLGRVSWIVEDI